MSTAKEWKDKGNGLVKEKKYKEALDCYSKAIEIDPNDPILYSNRSAMHLNLSEFKEALEDAEKALSIKSDYGKAYLRKGKALEGLNKPKEALEAYKLGLEKDKENAQLLQASQELEANLNNPFLKNYPKLFTDPRTADMMKDPQFRNLIDFAMKDQKVLMQMMQTDPRFMTVFSVLTGIDFEKMNEDVQKASEERKKEEEKKKKEEEEKKKKEEEERKKKEEEEKYNAMSEEEKKEVDDHKKADEIKAQGNEEFKKRNYDEAIKYYQQAIDLYPKEMVYYLNSAKCYLEKKDYDKAIELCKHVCDNSHDFTRRATAFGIIGYAYRAQNKLDEALKAFEDSQMEKNDVRIKEAQKETMKLKEKLEAEAYINPEIAEQENQKANELYKAGKFPEALKVYDEAIKRNPKLPKYYTNRAQCFIKLMEFYQAIKDCEKAIKIEPKTLKAYQKKANCHFITKEYHKVLQTVDDGLKLFPDDQELKSIREKTIIQINYGSGEDDAERQKKAAADPEIQKILRDPRIQQLFKDFKENPMSAQQAIMKDELIRNAFQKLVAAGLVKTK